MNRRLMMVGMALVVILASGTASWAESLKSGAVFTMSNAAVGNEVVAYERDADGSLAFVGTYPTGGLGTGTGLGNQSGLVLSRDGWLVGVNAGSDEVSLFRVRPHDLELTSRVASYGSRPISVTESHGLVYVLNAASLNIAGFAISHGELTPIAGSTQPIGGTGVDPAQIGLSPDGRALVVTLKDSSEIVTFAIDDHGAPGPGTVHASNGVTPFGFAFSKEGRLFVTEAAEGAPGASSLSSYAIRDDASLETITAAAPTNQTAACWVSVSPKGRRYAYTSNTPSATLTGFQIGRHGALSLLDPSGVTASTGANSAPVDSAFSWNGRYLYTLNSGSHTIGIFQVESDGSLVPAGAGPSIPDAANGIAAR